jgi:polysaccharide export outer membrane protein
MQRAWNRRGIWCVLLLCAGCQLSEKCQPRDDLPHERKQVPLPTYLIEAPDVLLIDAVRLVPLPPYKIAPLDVLGINVTNPLPEAPLTGLYGVDPDGTVNFGYTYGSVHLEGMTLEQAKKAIEQHLKLKLKPPYEATVLLSTGQQVQQIRGPHLVRIDGTIGLGVYGSVFVDGLSIADAKTNIEHHLSQFFKDPQISVDVSGFNSKVYYIVADGGGAGETVTRVPMQGKTTVLDALSQVNGLSSVSSKLRIKLVRPAASETSPEDVMHIDWNGIVRRGEVCTNYQVLPGDRIYVDAAMLVKADTYLGRFFAPIERVFGITALGNGTVRTFLTPIPTNNTQTLVNGP